jgi:rhodanese-related sulfurtransferase
MIVHVKDAKERVFDDDCVFVDVRTPGEFKSTFIPGATNVPLGDLEQSSAELDALLERGDVILVCGTGRRAEKAREALRQRGIENVRILHGGMQEWQQHGAPVVTGEGGSMSIERQVRVIAGTLALVGALLAFFINIHFVWLPAFIGAGVAHAGLTDTCALAMMLAKMPWNRRALRCAS